MFKPDARITSRMSQGRLMKLEVGVIVVQSKQLDGSMISNVQMSKLNTRRLTDEYYWLLIRGSGSTYFLAGM